MAVIISAEQDVNGDKLNGQKAGISDLERPRLIAKISLVTYAGYQSPRLDLLHRRFDCHVYDG